MTLYLCAHSVLRSPLLYLSLYLKAHRAEYYRLLQEVRERGAREAWLELLMDGVAETANRAFEAATRIVDLFKAGRERITTESDRAGSALRVHDLLQQNPDVTANLLAGRTGLSAPRLNAALADLQRLGVVAEVTGRRRGRMYAYRRYLAILSEGTTPSRRRPSSGRLWWRQGRPASSPTMLALAGTAQRRAAMTLVSGNRDARPVMRLPSVAGPTPPETRRA